MWILKNKSADFEKISVDFRIKVWILKNKNVYFEKKNVN